MNTLYDYDDGCLAVIGMAVRLPGADNVEEFWENLAQGRQSMEPIPDELLAAGLHAAARHEPDYVAMQSTMRDFDLFDAEFFGFSPREASIMDPQHRLVLEYAWRAFENAGHAPGDEGGLRTGVYSSSDMSGYLTGCLYHHILSGAVDVTEAVIGCDKDYLSTRIAYKCNFRGPAMTVQSSCSSSLLSVHTACQALLAGECDRALVTACTVMLPENLGYIYLPGGMRSPDGRCRPYDAEAAGTIFGNGVLAVLIRRLADAQAAGDNILAVVRASAASNDGSDKVGYTAPSVSGQALAINGALAAAGVDPADIDFVEGHGTATPLGDPVEVAALQQAYAPAGSPAGGKRPPIILSSLKGNIGHLDAAAGLASFCKAVLCLAKSAVPGTANFRAPNPAFGGLAPFYVSPKTSPLPRQKNSSRLGAVSGFGIGGTNVHIILQEAPESRRPSPPESRLPLVFSAHNEAAFEAARQSLADHLAREAERPVDQPSFFTLTDTAFTLAEGRAPQALRGAVTASNNRQAEEGLRRDGLSPRLVGATELPAFLFPGQGNLHPAMARGFYREESRYRELLGHLSRLAVEEGGPDIVALLKRCWAGEAVAAEALIRTEVAQPVLFALEAAFAQMMIEKGLAPSCLLGHSRGEYAAACVAGVFSSEEGIRLMVQRGRLMQSAPPGRMLVVSLPAGRIREKLGDAFDGLEISLINSSDNCVLTGEDQRLEACAAIVARLGQRSTYLKTSHAFHSAAMEGIMEPFGEIMAAMRLKEPVIPFFSNLTGRLAGAEVTTAGYWVRHLRQTVRFADGLAALSGRVSLAIEAGPGGVLRSLARQQVGRQLRVVPGLDPLGAETSGENESPLRTLAEVAADLWVQGGRIDWGRYFHGLEARRRPLPETSFTPKRYWISPGGEGLPAGGEAEGARSGLEKYSRACSSLYAPPETEVEKSIVLIWEELLFVDRIGIDDDFLELGGNSIHVMQMVRQAAGRGLVFTSKDVFASKTVRALARKARRAEARPEATPGPVEPPPYLRALMETRDCHYRLFAAPDNFDAARAGQLAAELAARHDALRLTWQKGRMRLAGEKEIDWRENNLDDLRQRSEAEATACRLLEQGDCGPLADRLEPESLRAWSLTLLPPGPLSPGPALALLVRTALADVPAMRLLEKEISAFLGQAASGGPGKRPVEGPNAAASWKSWLAALNPAARMTAGETEKAPHFIKTAEGPEPPWTIPGRPRELIIEAPADLAAQLESVARLCRAEPVEVLGAAMAIGLAREPWRINRLGFVNDGRHLVLGGCDPSGTVGSYCLTQEVAFPDLPTEEAIPFIKNALRSFKEGGVGPWTAPAGPKPSTICLWLGSQSENHSDQSRGPLSSGGLWTENGLREGLEAAFWMEAGRLKARLLYPETFGEEAAGTLGQTMFAALADLGRQCGENSRAARYIPADFQASGLTEADLAAILSQISG